MNMRSMLTHIVVAYLIGSVVAESATHHVSHGHSIQTAINNAQRGDTVFVSAGLYYENLELRTSIALIGSSGTHVYGTGTGSIVTVSADSCTITGLIIEHSGTMLVHEDAGILLRSDFNTITNNTLRDVLFGIYLYGSDGNRIENNTIIGRPELEQGERGSGIHLWNSHYNTFIANTISYARDGFYIQNANHTLIQDNEVHSLRYGLHYMYADSNVFLRNYFHNNVAGAAMMYSRGIILKHNIFLNNRGFASYGILLQDCHYSTADSNIIADNVTGLFFEASTNNRFRNNIIARNDVALHIFQNSITNTFTENNFIDNLNLLTIVGKRTESQWNVAGKGNYWSSYNGYDIDADGIGDVPMKIQNVFNYIEGKNANVRLYLYSPAAQALAVSAKAFPIIDLNKEIDAFPLMFPVDMRWAVELQNSFCDPTRSSRPHYFTSVGFVLQLLGFVVVGFAFVKVHRMVVIAENVVTSKH